jgi:hypothetical protein
MPSINFPRIGRPVHVPDFPDLDYTERRISKTLYLGRRAMKKLIGLGMGLFFILLTTAYAANPHQNFLSGSASPPGLVEHGHEPPGLAMLGKTPHGWSEGRKVRGHHQHHFNPGHHNQHNDGGLFD